MSNRPEPLMAAEQAMVGRVVASLRADRVCWKEIERLFGMERTQLWRCQRLAEGQMQQQNGGMQHPRSCETAVTA